MREYVSDITVEWAHCDAAAIVFFPNFYVWFDQGTERLFTANGLSYAELERDFGIHGMPLLENGTSFRNACRLGAKLKLTSRLEEWDGKTFRISHRIVHEDGREALEGFERRIFVVMAPESARGMKAIDVPEALKARFGD